MIKSIVDLVLSSSDIKVCNGPHANSDKFKTIKLEKSRNSISFLPLFVAGTVQTT